MRENRGKWVVLKNSWEKSGNWAKAGKKSGIYKGE